MTDFSAWVAGAGFAVVTAGALVKFLIDFTRRQQDLITNHITHSTDAMVKLEVAIRELIRVLEKK